MTHDTTSEWRPALNWRVRPATPGDLEGILTLQQECSEAPHWSTASWLQILSGQQGCRPIRACFVVEGEDKAKSGQLILGFSVACCAGELSELESVATLLSARGQGLGRTLCRQVMEWSRVQGARTMELEVRASNAVAMALYRTLGFAEQGARRRYYRDPIEDAILMSADLTAVQKAGELRAGE